MRRKDPALPQGAGRGRSLIAIRTSQHQQRKMQGMRSQLPRSYSSPASHSDPDAMHSSQPKTYVVRSFSSPDSKQMSYRRNSDSFYRPNTHGSRSEIDSDLENFEQFEECYIDIDADQEETVFGPYRRSPEREEPKRVVTALLPGSGIQRVIIKPISTGTTQTLQSARDAMKKMQKEKDEKAFTSQKFRPLLVKMPAHHSLQSSLEHSSPGIEELQSSPQLELEALELEREIDNAEQHLDGGVAIATEESDADTVSFRTKVPFYV